MGVIDSIRKELPVIREAPVSHLFALLIVAVLTIGCLLWINTAVVGYHRETAKIALEKLALERNEHEATISRYRHLVESAEIPGSTALTEIPNADIKKMAIRRYTAIRKMNEHYGQNIKLLQDKLARNEITEQRFRELREEEKKRAAVEYEQNHRIDTQMIRRELMNRIPPERRQNMIRLPEVMPADKRAGSVSLYDVVPAEFSFYLSESLAREVEELSKLLPTQAAQNSGDN